MEYYYRRTPNYGALTELSKSLNTMLGDESGKTITNRTAQGFKHVFNAPNLNDEDAEGVVHAGMAGAALLLNSTNEGHKTTGLLLAFALLICYQSGK